MYICVTFFFFLVFSNLNHRATASQVLTYSIFWVVILASKFSFNFFFMIRPLVASTITVWDVDIGGTYDLGFVVFDDPHNIGVLVGLWISVGFVYFIDLQVCCSCTLHAPGGNCSGRHGAYTFIPLSLP